MAPQTEGEKSNDIHACVTSCSSYNKPKRVIIFYYFYYFSMNKDIRNEAANETMTKHFDFGDVKIQKQ